MPLPTLDQFIQQHIDQRRQHSNSHVRKRGFLTLYVRLGPRYIQGKLVPLVLDIATVVARPPGKRHFTTLVKELQERGFSLYVESVVNPRFARMLPRLGFVRVTPEHDAPSFFLAKEE
jgi:hypothetical protein